MESEWRIYAPDGSFTPAGPGLEDEGLADLYACERAGTRVAEDAPPHIALMREHQLAGYEPASDAGNLRWYPRGLLVKRLLEQHVTSIAAGYGAMEVETPVMYDYGHPALSAYLERFPARQYVVRSDDRELFLRFAACFGQYMIMHDMTMSHHDLPVRLYELTHFSFRREQGGEVAGLRRLRAFTMPDMHTLVSGADTAEREFLGQARLCLRWLDDLGLACVPAIRLVRSFLDGHPGLMRELMRMLGRPALAEVWDDRSFYFVAKFEMNFIDAAKKAACLSTVQIDVENAERFGISYIAGDGRKRHPLLLHASVSGSVDRNVYAILEAQAMRARLGGKAGWPVWLAPVQVRLAPVAPEHVEGALRLAEAIPFRAEVDDRNVPLGRKIRDSEQEWVPYTLVVGRKELSGGTLTVRARAGGQPEMSAGSFAARLAAETEGRPARPANTPLLLSRRPAFT